MAGGVNLFSYVLNAPTIGIDPLGLWKYEAFCRYISGGEVIGGGVLKCRIEGPCMRNNKKEIWMTTTFLVGTTFGLPGSLSYFEMTLDDYDWTSNYPDGSKLIGPSYIFTGGYAQPGPWKGESFTKLKLGSTYYEGWGKTTGLDASIDYFGGYTSWNKDIPQYNWQEDCCYGK